jgi:outer membrane protein OmpA-like peptidoglycan-associated protein
MSTVNRTSRLAPIALAVAVSISAGCSAARTPGGLIGGGTATGTKEAPPAPTVQALPHGDLKDYGPSLVSLSAGALVVKRPSEWAGFASAFNLIDERPRSIWATERYVTAPQTIVIALAERTSLKVLEFDSGSAELQFKGCSAKNIVLEMSDESEDAGYRPIARVALEDRTDGQRFPVAADVPGRWVRLTVENNHGSNDVTELGEFRAYGTQLTQTPFPDIGGTWNAYVTGDIHIRQQGSSITACYESLHGLVDGGVEGHVVKFTWIEKTGGAKPGRGIMVFTPDAKRFVSIWWGPYDGGSYGSLVIGTRTSDDVASCTHGTGSPGDELAKKLEASGRATVYGINFDTDSDAIREESRPTLDSIAAVLMAKPTWKVTIEGHTDSVATDEHNQDLSERRARAVRDFLEAAGVDASRLETAGYGATKPVTDNDTELGRAQNRRVELAKQ